MKEKVILAYSGGLDTTAIIPWLKENYDYEVICCCIDVGQKDELDGLEERAKKCGATKLYIKNVVEEYVDDYIIPNTALENDELDANYFQHQPYLDGFNNDYGTHLASVLKVHFEPLGVYAGGSSEIKDTLTLDDIKDGAQIAVPNDGTNEARALQLLEAHGLIKIKAGVGLAATVLDIEENPKNIKIVEIEAKNLSAILPDVDYAVINGNYALSADIVDKLCVSEDKNSEGAQEYANVLVVKEGHENDEKIEALKKALTSADTKTFIENTFGTLVIPVFD